MLAMLMSAILFSFLVFMGNILMFIDKTAYQMIPIFFVGLLIVQMYYRKPNCRSLELKDFVLSAVMTIIFSLLILLSNKEVSYHEFFYLYLITFLSLILFADSRRFKSLM